MVKDARIYRELAAVARGWGYTRVSGAAVHNWRKKGLLPRVIVRHERFGGTSTEIPAEAVERLRVLCHLRFDEGIRDLALVGLLMWLDDQRVSIDVARRGAKSAATLLPRMLERAGARARSRDPEDPDADLDAAAVKFAAVARTTQAEVGGEPVETQELEVASMEFFRGITGRTTDVDAAVLEPLGRLIGLRRAATEAPPGVGPWLGTDPGAALAEFVGDMNGPTLVERIDKATDVELLSAREAGRDLHMSIGVMAELTDLTLPPGQYGFGFMRPAFFSSPLWRAAPFLVALTKPGMARDAAETFRRTSAGLTALVELGRLWLDEHPEHRADVEARGLMAVVNDLSQPRSLPA